MTAFGKAGLGSRVAALALAVATASCTVVFDPERTDEVYRCDFDVDCPDTEDPRYGMECRVGEAHQDVDRDFPKICAPVPKVSCDPDEFSYHSDFRTRWREAMSIDGRYDEACMEPIAVAGCPPAKEGCAPGLTRLPASGRCDDTNESTPPAVSPEPIVAAQDVLDSFCRTVFCDQRFVCDKKHYECVPCVLGEPLGGGGCGDLYVQGVRSSVYKTDAQLHDECQGADLEDFDDVKLAPVQ